MTRSQTELPSAPEAIEDQPLGGGPLRTVSLLGGRQQSAKWSGPVDKHPSLRGRVRGVTSKADERTQLCVDE